MTSRDLRWLVFTRKCRHVSGRHLEVAAESRKLVYTMHFTSCKAVDHSIRQSRDWKWRHVTSDDRKWPGSVVTCRKTPGSGFGSPKTRVYCTFHFLQGCSPGRMQSRDRKWRHVMSGDWKWPEVASFDWKSPGTGCRRPKTRVHCSFLFLQGSNSR